MILVTGADGFVGSALCRRLSAAERRFRRVVQHNDGSADTAVVPDIAGSTELAACTEGTSAVIHLAARAHVVRDTAVDPMREYVRVNVQGSEALARAALASGVRRFVFVSSIGVLGERTEGTPFGDDSEPRPVSDYARSKLMAEQAITAAASGRMEVIIVRPALMYGNGVKGNMLRLLGLVDRLPALPFGAVKNRRSFLAVDTLVDFLLLSVDQPHATQRTFVLADPRSVSTPALVGAMAEGLGRRVRLLRVPPSLMKTAAILARSRRHFDQLCGDLEVDATQAHRFLGNRSARDTVAGVCAMARWYRSNVVSTGNH